MEVTTNEEIKTEEQLIEEKKLRNKKKINIDLYKSYRTFAYDLMFYYAIEYLFLTVEKGLSAAQVLKFNAFYILFKFITQIPVTILIQRTGKRSTAKPTMRYIVIFLQTKVTLKCVKVRHIRYCLKSQRR